MLKHRMIRAHSYPLVSFLTNSSAIVIQTERTLEGIPASAGIAIAHTWIVAQQEETSLEMHDLDDTEVEVEIERLATAIMEADKVLEQIELMAREDVHDRAEIFEALRMMLLDPSLGLAITSYIKANRCSAHAAIKAEMERLADIFSRSGDETMRSRAEDIRALQSHLIACVLKTPVTHFFSNDAALILSSLSPSDAVLYARNRASAFVLESGGINSHTAILARAFGIPMVSGVRDAARIAPPHSLMIVDGYHGRVIINPERETLEHYRKQKALLEAQREQLGALRDHPAETLEGERIVLAANLDMIDEFAAVVENGADEIGLMRTEYLVMDRTADITMEEQLLYYRQLAERAYPLVVTLRAFDIGSEKLTGEIWGRSSSPLGLRGARLLLKQRELLERQIEAVLRASSMKNLRLMFPMVSSVKEMRQFREITAAICERLRGNGVQFDEHMPLGAMIETPAAALTADALARECDFLSLGTNDLSQYTLAVDRADDALRSYYDELHPSVLKLIRASAIAATRAGIPLTLCGELAANPLATEVLLGIGIRRFSVQPLELGPLKLRIRSTSIQRSAAIARDILKMGCAEEVRRYLKGLQSST